MRNLIFLILLFTFKIGCSQVIIPDSTRETVVIGSTWGMSLNKINDKDYYNFKLKSGVIKKIECKISFTATSNEIDDLYNFFLSKFGTRTKSEITLGNSKILVRDKEYGLSFGNSECHFLVENEKDLKYLFGK